MSKVNALRLKILDKYQVIIGEVLGRGDSEIKAFKFQYSPLINKKITIYSDGDEVKDSHYDFKRITKTEWQVVFNYPIDGGIKITADYKTAAFSDAELEAFLFEADNIYFAAHDAIEDLTEDRLRFETWAKNVDSKTYSWFEIMLKKIFWAIRKSWRIISLSQ